MLGRAGRPGTSIFPEADSGKAPGSRLDIAADDGRRSGRAEGAKDRERKGKGQREEKKKKGGGEKKKRMMSECVFVRSFSCCSLFVLSVPLFCSFFFCVLPV